MLQVLRVLEETEEDLVRCEAQGKAADRSVEERQADRSQEAYLRQVVADWRIQLAECWFVIKPELDCFALK